MRRIKYAVIENVPGYLPETDNGYHTNRRDAEYDALERADQYRYDGDVDDRGLWRPTYRVRGNMRDGYIIERLDAEYDLGVTITIEPAEEELYRGDDGRLYDTHGNVLGDY